MNSCEYADEDTKILTASSDKTVKLFNVEDGSLVRTYFTGHTGIITEARASEDLSKYVNIPHWIYIVYCNPFITHLIYMPAV